MLVEHSILSIICREQEKALKTFPQKFSAVWSVPTVGSSDTAVYDLHKTRSSTVVKFGALLPSNSLKYGAYASSGGSTKRGLVSLFFFLCLVTGSAIEAVFFMDLHAPAALATFAFGAPFLCDFPESLFFPKPSPQFERATVSLIDAVFVQHRRTVLNVIPIIYSLNSVFSEMEKSVRYSCYDNWN